jgi:integrase
MALFKRGSIWWIELEFRGQRIRKSTGSKSRTLAVKAEHQLRRELEESANGIKQSRKPMLFSPTVREWMSANQARWSKANVAIQNYNIKRLNGFFGSMLLTDITPQHIGKYQSKRQKEGASNRTINMEVATLRMVLKSVRLWITLAQDVKMLPEQREIGKALTVDEETRLLDACRKSSSPSLSTAVVIFRNTGLRNAELRCARWHQVDFLKAEFQVGKAKTEGSAGRIIPLNETALRAFKDWHARWPEAKPGDYIFPSEKLVFKGFGAAEKGIMTPYAVDRNKPMGSWKRAWATAKKQAGVECRIHDLRHSFISALAQTQTTDATIQALSGHLTRQMLDHYSHVRMEAKRQAVESLEMLNGQTVH